MTEEDAEVWETVRDSITELEEPSAECQDQGHRGRGHAA